MKNFNAQKAKQISESVLPGDLYKILTEIKEQAEQGETILYVYRPLTLETLETLRDRGFRVINANIIDSRKNGMYYYISWD